METVNNIASAASKAIWGDSSKKTDTPQTEEPKSGETGNVSAGEPYDKGNEEPISTPSNETTDPTTSSTSDTNTNATMSDTPSTKTDLPGNTPTTMPIRSEHETSKTGVTSANDPASATSTDKPTSSNDTSGAGPAPSVGADPSSAPQETQKQQGADRPTDEPTSEEHDRIAETKKEAEDAAKVDTSGPGPKPLSEVKKDGGDAGAGAGAGEDDGPQKESHGEGTGEKYVKSSGMKADGGDFDAANPGAGKEADRLLETKGIHHETSGSTDDSSKTESKEDEDTTGSPSGGKLKGLKEKIKAKLHKN